VSRKYFGTDGVRGRVGEHPLTVDFALRLASSAARVLAPEGGTVLVGKDTRLSGYMFEAALEAGFAAAGVNVMLIGPLPTPAIAYLTTKFECDFGVVISASHNPYEDNGIKFFDGNGGKLNDEIELQIEQHLDETPRTRVLSTRVARPSLLDTQVTGGSWRCCSMRASTSSESLAPSLSKNLMPLSSYRLCEALMTTPKSHSKRFAM